MSEPAKHLRLVDRDAGWQREGATRDWHEGEKQARAELAEVVGTDALTFAHYDALREEIRERRAIEVEVDTLAPDHADIDALAEHGRLPALRVPSATAPLRTLLWFLVRRWWQRRRRVPRDAAWPDSAVAPPPRCECGLDDCPNAARDKPLNYPGACADEHWIRAVRQSAALLRNETGQPGRGAGR